MPHKFGMNFQTRSSTTLNFVHYIKKTVLDILFINNNVESLDYIAVSALSRQ